MEKEKKPFAELEAKNIAEHYTFAWQLEYADLIAEDYKVIWDVITCIIANTPPDISKNFRSDMSLDRFWNLANWDKLNDIYTQYKKEHPLIDLDLLLEKIQKQRLFQNRKDSEIQDVHGILTREIYSSEVFDNTEGEWVRFYIKDPPPRR
jgi:hypothetical protein